MSTPTRRQVLRTGAVGAATAAFLAACSTSNDSEAGQSGVSPTTAAVPPTVPVTEPKPSALENDVTLMRTATSLELLAADIYAAEADQLDDPTWAATAARFGEDHAAAAVAFQFETPGDAIATEPNEYLIENYVGPSEGTLNSDRARLNYFQGIENAIVATYNSAIGQYTDADGRSFLGTYAAASAGRAAALGNGGEGQPPTSAQFSTKDLIPNAAFVPATPQPVDDQTVIENQTEEDGS